MMPNITLEQAQAISKLRCPLCKGEGYVLQEQHMQDEVTIQAPCPTCEGLGTLAYKGEFPSLWWWYSSQMPTPRLILRTCELDGTWGMHYADTVTMHPAPDPIRALMWLEEVGLILEWNRNSYGWGAHTRRYTNSRLHFEQTPEALLGEVLAVLGKGAGNATATN